MTREGVPKLVRVEVLDAGPTSNLFCESVRTFQWADSADAGSQLFPKRRWQRHSPDSPRLRAMYHQSVAGDVRRSGSDELAPAKSGLHEESRNESVWLFE